MKNNKLMIAAAGSGKTTYLIEEAYKIKKQNVLITTYTEANKEEIKKKIIKKIGYIPGNIKIETWFSFLLQHGVRPYQSELNEKIHKKKIGFHLTEKPSGLKFVNRNGRPVYFGELNFFNYYFTKNLKINSDKVSKFIIESNKKTSGEIINRISRIYPNIFIDEVQDLAGWELEIIKAFFYTESKVLLVGDPRQVTYLTHHSKKYAKYRNGKIDKFITQECKKDVCEIDFTTLNNTHRNNKYICDFSSKLFKEHKPCYPCECELCRKYIIDHEGVFLVKTENIQEYCKVFSPTILRWNGAMSSEWNFGKSKGLTFDRVLIYPTKPIINWLKDNNQNLTPISRCKFYVATTRAKYSIGIVCNDNISGIEKYVSQNNT